MFPGSMFVTDQLFPSLPLLPTLLGWQPDAVSFYALANPSESPCLRCIMDGACILKNIP
jgi:hypothetical protein